MTTRQRQLIANTGRLVLQIEGEIASLESLQTETNTEHPAEMEWLKEAALSVKLANTCLKMD